MKTTAEILQGAKELIQNVGWCQGAYVKFDVDDQPTAYCLSGAMMRAAAVDNPSRSAGVITSFDDQLIRAYIRVYKTTGDIVATMYNDNPNTTKEMVLEILDRAIEDERKDTPFPLSPLPPASTLP